MPAVCGMQTRGPHMIISSGSSIFCGFIIFTFYSSVQKMVQQLKEYGKADTADRWNSKLKSATWN